MKRLLVILILIALGAGAYVAWTLTHRKSAAAGLALHGNVDLRQVDLAFNNNERIAAVLVQEGDRVHKGQLLARLDTSRLTPQLAQAEAQGAVVDRLHHGNRPEEIAQARANLEAAQADAANARQQYDRLNRLKETTSGSGVSQQDIDNAKAALDMAVARVAVNQKALELEIAGPRKEDIAQAEAQLQGEQAQVAFLRRQLADAELYSPCEGIIRSRLMEPGEMASPQRAVFSIAVMDPKWVRAYVDEPDLGKVRPGMAAGVTVDSFPGRSFRGWVGFISPVAEFTPKDVQTEQLRTSLVYEVRVFVIDPTDDLRLGMPATVNLLPNQSATAAEQNAEARAEDAPSGAADAPATAPSTAPSTLPVEAAP